MFATGSLAVTCGDIVPTPYRYPPVVSVCLGNRGKEPENQFGGRKAEQAAYPPKETRTSGYKANTDKMAASQSGLSLATENPDGLSTQFDLRPHMESDRWPQIYAGIQQHLQKIYNGKEKCVALKKGIGAPEEDGHTDVKKHQIVGVPRDISEVDWMRRLHLGMIPKNLPCLMESSATREYSSLIHTFFLTHTVGGVFLSPEDKALYFLDVKAVHSCNVPAKLQIIVNLRPKIEVLFLALEFKNSLLYPRPSHCRSKENSFGLDLQRTLAADLGLRNLYDGDNLPTRSLFGAEVAQSVVKETTGTET
ncbi:hypothetical protein Tco_0499291 [Tanacetum coccineum]